MTGVLRVRRSRGALSGAVLVVLGAWGALIPFIGHFAYTPDQAWVYTSARLWLEIVPGAATVAGGLILLGSANRAFAAFGACLAALAGAWFVIGPTLARLWASSELPQIGSPVGGTLQRAVEQLGFFTGLGVVIVFSAALALGRLAVIGAGEAEPAATRSWRPPGSPTQAEEGEGHGPRSRRLEERTEAGNGAAGEAEPAAAAAGAADATHPRKETSMLRDFKNFLMQGELVVIAVALVVALAFSTLIQSFAANIITPLVNATGGGAAGEGLGWTINGQRVDLGAFISAIIYFIIFMAVIYFVIVVPYRTYMRRRGTTVFGEPEPTRTCPECKAADLPIDATRCKYCASQLTAVSA